MRSMMLLTTLAILSCLAACADEQPAKRAQSSGFGPPKVGLSPGSGVGGFKATQGGWGPGNAGFRPAESTSGREKSFKPF